MEATSITIIASTFAAKFFIAHIVLLPFLLHLEIRLAWRGAAC